MTLIKYISLGLIQGLTEFLPVSSSAHLVIFQELFQIEQNQILLDIVLHLGTLAALVVFLFPELKLLLQKKILFYIALVTLVTATIAILGQGLFEPLFASSRNLSLPLLITGLVLLGTKRFARGARRFAELKTADSLWLGLTQGLAVIPGLSRAGLTISTLLFRGVEKETAFKFSFLASIFAILGALLFKLEGFSQIGPGEFGYMCFGFVASFFSGLLALKILFAVVRKARLHLFGYYCLVLALVTIIWR